MFNLALDCKLRACDFIKLKVRDIAHGTTVQSRAILVQQKTGKPVQFEITPKTKVTITSKENRGSSCLINKTMGSTLYVCQDLNELNMKMLFTM
jgi:hypothetical protein